MKCKEYKGEVAERSKAAVLKTAVSVVPTPGVQIPPSPYLRMEKFPYPLNIILITYSIIIEIQEMITQINNNNQNKKYTKKLEFLLNLPPEYNFINTNELINLINNRIINKIEKLYNNTKIDLSITKENFDNFLNITIIYNK